MTLSQRMLLSQRNTFVKLVLKIIEELVDVLDENGQTVWEETGETEPLYTLVDHGTYKAALVSCKLI